MTPFQANCQTKQLVPHQMQLQVWWSPGALGPKPFRIPQELPTPGLLTRRASTSWVVSSLFSEPDSLRLPPNGERSALCQCPNLPTHLGSRDTYVIALSLEEVKL